MGVGNSILSSYGTTVFTRMSALAAEHGAINLGQGFPDGAGPADVCAKASEALLEGDNQYPPMMGIPELRQAVAEHSRRFYGLEVDWRNEVMVTSGATEALAACILGLVEPGDKVALIEPLYDCYNPMARRAGAEPILMRMQPPGWELPRQELAAAFRNGARLLILNSPHNPIGKVFGTEELDFIAALLEEHDAYAICDEVYEHLVYGGVAHIPLMSRPGMRRRCLRVGSAGKTFSLTGWKVGYVTAAEELLRPVAKAHQFLTFTTPPNLQHAAAYGLGLPDVYFQGLASEMQARRDQLAAGLEKAGFQVMRSDGTYFLTADFRPLGFTGTDEEFCRHITLEAGVTAVPMSAFYADGEIDHLARFCFCKSEQVLEEAVERLCRHFA